MIRCVTFDIDDTLYLERDYVRSGFEAVGELVRGRYGVDGFAAWAWSKFLDGARRTVFDDVVKEHGLEAIDVAELVASYRAHEPVIELLPDALDCLDHLRPIFSLAAITDGPALSQHAKIRALRLRDWIPEPIVTSDLGEGFAKPHAMAFELVEETLGVQGSECAYVGDNPQKDFLGPKRRGWATVRIRRPLSLHVAVPSDDSVDLEIDDLSRLAALLSRDDVTKGIRSGS
jgi:putative hydrolase of the HAD superfamily